VAFLTPGLLTLGTINILGQVSSFWGAGAVCPVHWRMLSSIPSLCVLDSSSSPPDETTNNVCGHCQMFPGLGGKTGSH